MQLFAIDSQDKCIHAKKAAKQIDYHCIECKKKVRLRRGPHRQAHFYHLDPSPLCRQHQKGAEHLQLQAYFFDRLPKGDCRIEFHIQSINRIADVAWLSRKVIFEIQYSAISATELLARNRDYRAEGWIVYWILHDHRYNKFRLSSAEMALTHLPHYYSNFDHQGKGMIYDQFDIRKGGMRIAKLPPLEISIEQIEDQEKNSSNRLETILKRSAHWPYRFHGDLLSLPDHQPGCHYLMKAAELEKRYKVKNSSLRKAWWKAVKKPYQQLFHYLLKKMCQNE